MRNIITLTLAVLCLALQPVSAQKRSSGIPDSKILWWRASIYNDLEDYEQGEAWRRGPQEHRGICRTITIDNVNSKLLIKQ
jgi:hypothetical protein